MDYKLLLFDLDGTLLRSDKTISKNTLSVLNKCREKGLMIGVSTSRSEQNSMTFLSELLPDILISSGGALVKRNGEYIYKAEFSQEETTNMIKTARAICGSDCEITIDTLDEHFWNYKIDPKKQDQSWGDSIYTDFEDFNQSSLKMCVEIFDTDAADMLKNALPDCDCIRFSDGCWYKFTKKGVTKENAIMEICLSCNIETENIIAFGDDYADIGMIKLCGTGVAMGNAIQEVKQIADIVIGTNDDEGIAEYLTKKFDLQAKYKTAIPFWEETYQKDNVMTFSVEPNKTVKEFEHLINKQSNILEAGCGEGQNVLYLAQQGFQNIDAFDISEFGIAKLKRLCEIRNVEVNAFTHDLTTYAFDKKYDLIMSFATLCFVEKSKWKQFIEKAKDNTNIGGIHIMHIFTDMVPASADIAPFAVGLAKDGEIREMYNDWEILQFQSYTFEDEHPNVPKHMHSVNKIVARKVN